MSTAPTKARTKAGQYRPDILSTDHILLFKSKIKCYPRWTIKLNFVSLIVLRKEKLISLKDIKVARAVRAAKEEVIRS